MDTPNYEVFRDCLSTIIVEKSNETTRQPKRKSYRARRNHNAEDTPQYLPPARASPEELADFVDFLASEIFTSLPAPLQTLTYSDTQATPPNKAITQYTTAPLPTSLIETISNTVPPSVPDTLTTYALLSPHPTTPSTPSDNPDSDPDLLPSLLTPLLTTYIATITAPPPIWSQTRPSACEICSRDWIPLSYHHLIPRSVHEKVRKRGWHEEWRLNSVAWLCRACHSFVHRMAGNEELAREWFTVERIWDREDVRVWAGWVGRVRWKKT